MRNAKQTAQSLFMRSAIAFIACAVLVTGCSAGGVLDSGREDLIPLRAGDIPAQDVETRFIPPAERGDPVRLSGVTADVTVLTTEEFSGAPLVINAWASWCAPCVAEAPILTAAALDSPLTVRYLGLRVMDGTQQPPPELAAMPFMSMMDTDGLLLASIPGVPPRALPSTTVLDAQGRIAAQRIGPITAQILEAMIGSAQ